VFLPKPANQQGPTHIGFCVRGQVPPAVLRAFCSRRAFIYFLETWAQVITCYA